MGWVSSMHVVVELFGTLQRHLEEGQRTVELEVEEDTTILELLLKLGVDPNEPWNASLDGRLAYPSDVVSEGSMVILFPPIAGGS